MARKDRVVILCRECGQEIGGIVEVEYWPWNNTTAIYMEQPKCYCAGDALTELLDARKEVEDTEKANEGLQKQVKDLEDLLSKILQLLGSTECADSRVDRHLCLKEDAERWIHLIEQTNKHYPVLEGIYGKSGSETGSILNPSIHISSVLRNAVTNRRFDD